MVEKIGNKVFYRCDICNTYIGLVWVAWLKAHNINRDICSACYEYPPPEKYNIK